MIVDSSAIVAIFFQEPGFEALISKLADAGEVGISAPTLVECAIVLSARLDQDLRLLTSWGQETRLAHEDQVVIPDVEDVTLV